jgi:sugar/nucleoside kinase (ribokinase family)
MHQGIVISLGSVNADFQVRVECRPDLSETVMAQDFLKLSGGKAANVAYLARSWAWMHATSRASRNGSFGIRRNWAGDAD